MKIYFHIGQAKTGSSAIQAFLNYNREKLATDYKILYPNFDTQNYDKGLMHNHSLLIKNQSEAEREVIFDKFKDVVEYSKKAGYRSIIISLECFGLKVMPELFHQIVARTGIETEFILYLRRQDLWAESAWKQWGHKREDCDNIQNYLEIINLDWLSTIKNWLEYFIPAQINIRPYEENFIGKDVVLDFLKTIGISSKDDFIVPPQKNHNTNYGFAREIVEILRLTKLSVSSDDDNKFMDFLAENLPERYLKKDFTASYQMLSPKERMILISKYEQSNNEIARIFCGNQRPKLFVDPLPDENQKWEPFTGLNINTVVSVFMDILYRQSQNIKALQNQIEILKQTSPNAKPNLNRNHAFVSIDFKTLVRKIIYKNDLTKIKIKRGALWLYASGNDPYLAFPMSIFPDNPQVLAIDITVPEATTIQVFFSADRGTGFEEKNSSKMQLTAGRSNVIMPVENYDAAGMLRIDPGQVAGEYIIHELRAGY